MDKLITRLKDKARVQTREVAGKGPVEALIIEERKEVQPGLFVETWIPVDDFKTMFPTPAHLQNAAPALGYEKLKKELEQMGEP